MPEAEQNALLREQQELRRQKQLKLSPLLK
jgi:hypothetical protein